MQTDTLETRAGRFFWQVTTYPKTILTIGLLVIGVSAAFLPRLTKDTSSEAFMPTDHPAVVYREKVKEIFGLADPIVVAIVNEGPTGVFNPHSLRLVSWLTERVTKLPNVDPERVTSLATEKNIVGTQDGMVVKRFFEMPPAIQEEADQVRRAVMDSPLHLGRLVARDGQATVIVAELLNEKAGEEAYEQILTLAKEAPVQGEQIHVAGEAAVIEYLGEYIHTDAERLNPVAILLVTGILFLAYRTLRGVLLPNLVVIGAIAVGLGTMAAAGVPFYVITNGLTVILIATSTADGIHILGQYYEEMAQRPGASSRELVVRAMVRMWRPVTMTSLTDIGGFLGIGLATFMPPMKWFGIFAAIGSVAALVLSLFVVPAALVILRPRLSKAFRPQNGPGGLVRVDWFGRVTGLIGRGVARRPGWVLAVASVVAVVGVVGALRLEVNEARIENFKHSEPIYQADRIINQTMDGTNYLDIVVETPNPEGLFNPEHLRRIEALQAYLKTLPHVKGTISIVDYLKQMNRAVNENRPEAYRLPDDPNLVAQYFLLYSASGDPTDLREEIDSQYQLANVRATLDTGLYTNVKVVVEAAEQYVHEKFNAPGIKATVDGRLNVNYNWIKELGPSTFRGVLVTFFGVLLMVSLSFRSLVAGLLAMVPVSMAVLLIYAVMGFAGIWLGVGTSMFASIAIGTGVNFSIHNLDRLIVLLRDERRAMDEAFSMLYPSTGRALLFDFSAVFFGFGVLTISQVPSIIWFGDLVAVSVSVCFLAALTVLPALVKVLRPAFLGFEHKTAWVQEAAELEGEE